MSSVPDLIFLVASQESLKWSRLAQQVTAGARTGHREHPVPLSTPTLLAAPGLSPCLVFVSPSATQVTANQKLFILLWVHPEDIHTACVNSRDCLVFLLIHRSPFAAAEVALSSRSVGLRSWFQLWPKNRPGLKCLFNPVLLSRTASLGEDTFSRCFCKSVLIKSNKPFHVVKHLGF